MTAEDGPGWSDADPPAGASAGARRSVDEPLDGEPACLGAADFHAGGLDNVEVHGAAEPDDGGAEAGEPDPGEGGVGEVAPGDPDAGLADGPTPGWRLGSGLSFAPAGEDPEAPEATNPAFFNSRSIAAAARAAVASVLGALPVFVRSGPVEGASVAAMRGSPEVTTLSFVSEPPGSEPSGSEAVSTVAASGAAVAPGGALADVSGLEKTLAPLAAFCWFPISGRVTGRVSSVALGFANDGGVTGREDPAAAGETAVSDRGGS